jgi:hypothetical protein
MIRDEANGQQVFKHLPHEPQTENINKEIILIYNVPRSAEKLYFQATWRHKFPSPLQPQTNLPYSTSVIDSIIGPLCIVSLVHR